MHELDRNIPSDCTDILFHVSSRQVLHLKKTPNGGDFDFEYEGILTPDIEPDAQH